MPCFLTTPDHDAHVADYLLASLADAEAEEDARAEIKTTPDPDEDRQNAAFAAQLDAELAELDAQTAGKVATTPTPARPRKTPAHAGSGAPVKAVRLASQPPHLPTAPAQPSPAPASHVPSPVHPQEFGQASEASAGRCERSEQVPSQGNAVPDHWRRLIRHWAARMRNSLPSRHRRPRLPARWRDHDHLQKMHRAGEALTLQHGLRFSLNLAPTLQDTLRQHADPVRLMGAYIARALKAAGLDLGFSFAFDVSPCGKLHLHGLIERPADPAYLDKLKDALRKAGGRVPAASRACQLTIDTLGTGWSWIAYMTKAADAVNRYLGQAVAPFMSRRLTQLAQGHAERVRGIAEARKAAPVPDTAPQAAQEAAAPAPVPVPPPAPVTTAISAMTLRRFASTITRAFRRIVAEGRNWRNDLLTFPVLTPVLVARGQPP